MWNFSEPYHVKLVALFSCHYYYWINSSRSNKFHDFHTKEFLSLLYLNKWYFDYYQGERVLMESKIAYHCKISGHHLIEFVWSWWSKRNSYTKLFLRSFEGLIKGKRESLYSFDIYLSQILSNIALKCKLHLKSWIRSLL